jgi:hypothetical protein
MAEARDVKDEPQTDQVEMEERPVNINDIGQRTINSTTTVLVAPNGELATVHLGWIVTIGPLDDEDEEFLADEDGTIGDQDRELLEDGAYVLSHGCKDRQWYHVESDPASVRGYATAMAANMLVEYGGTVMAPVPVDTRTGRRRDRAADTKNAADPRKSPNDSAGSAAASGAIPNTGARRDEGAPAPFKAEPSKK